MTGLVEVNCALCGSSAKIPQFTTRDGHHLARCRECGFQFYSPRPQSGRIEAYYHGQEFYEKVNITAVEIVMDILAYLGMKPGTLLDVGCGVGALVALARKKGWDAVGIDPSPKAVELAKQVLDLEIRQAYLQDADLEPESFDVIVLLAVLEHAFEPVAVMNHVRRFLKPGGRVIFSTPNLDNLTYHLMRAKPEYDWFIKEHINHFTITTHRALLEKTGFMQPEFHMCGHFAIEKADEGTKLLPTATFPRAARKLFAESLEPVAQRQYHKSSADLSDSELLDIIAQQAAAWNLEQGEYSLSDAVYVSAHKPHA